MSDGTRENDIDTTKASLDAGDTIDLDAVACRGAGDDAAGCPDADTARPRSVKGGRWLAASQPKVSACRSAQADGRRRKGRPSSTECGFPILRDARPAARSSG